MFQQRTHYCGNVKKSDIDQTVVLFGWVHVRRDHGGVIFVDLRDSKGTIQVVFDSEHSREVHQTAETLRNEFVICVEGLVRIREEANMNPNIPNGDIEVLAAALTVLNSSESLPFQINGDAEISDKLRLTYRYLDLRRSAVGSNIMLRSRVSKLVRDYLYKNDFNEIETPFLTKSTPEGARDYIVPSRIHKGAFFALPQSPQLFKQLLMVGGMDRYFQIVRCFRDEDLRGNRQPEFTQIDIELSFHSAEYIMQLSGGMILHVFEEITGQTFNPEIPIITYDDAMNLYGSDAPDLRFDLKLADITDLAQKTSFNVFTGAVDRGGIVKVLRVPGGSDLSRKDLDELTELAKVYHAKGLAWVKLTEEGWQSPIAKFIPDEIKARIISRTESAVGDLLLFGADKSKIVFDALGQVRKDVAVRKGLIPENTFSFVWVVDFPMFEYDGETDRLYSCHHPFTAPKPEDFTRYAAAEPLRVKAQAYDLVLNGVEIGGGSIRIHSSELQHAIFGLLGLSNDEINEKFGFFVEALKYGAPPHGGIAFGFDRLMMFLCQTESIRDVIAFPKTQLSSCLLTAAPSGVSRGQLRDLGISIDTD